ncbi:hypothetical protein ThidrDRAFT_4669 [Thiorhodococcus drewsii AZ1]|uniref:Uncharacterized protein n=1 Tax=Thiorhodococcus drewsii AZ1 TaxID=765913 RepID=G2E8Q5_9GAMM|nr:hypothetical protein ThidrDRAFT_4669 [Thiorhodococcus drewsii AZ1]
MLRSQNSSLRIKHVEGFTMSLKSDLADVALEVGQNVATSDVGKEALKATAIGGGSVATIGAANVIGGAGVATGSTTAVTAANTVLAVGTSGLSAATTAAGSVPVFGGALASGLTTAATTAATAGATVGAAAVAAAPVVLPTLAIYGLWKLFSDD